MILGLTGGMGCGKSTASRFFADEGFRLLDADLIVHELLADDPRVREAIADRFGEEVFGAGGAVDRRKLGACVFSDDAALQWLENLLHPRVGAVWREEVSRHARDSWVVQIPLLFEKKLEHSFDFTVCVGTSAETQRHRLLQRGLSDREIARRISRQLPLEEKTARADFFLLNDGSLTFLHEQVLRLCRQLDQTQQRCSS